MGSLQLSPNASDLVYSLRGLGYTPATAIADLVDNSVAAGATQVEVFFEWDAEPTVRVIDNGRGMTADQLVEAMRFGNDPRQAREAGALGRFGLGLKTASLSQAAVLTVVSRADGGEAVAAQWDLARVEAAKSWELARGAPSAFGVEGALPHAHPGTAVVWSNLDRLLAAGRDVDAFFSVADAVSRHLGMIFHRYLEADRLNLLVNGARVPVWNPLPVAFCETVAAADLADGVHVRGCVLRAPDDLPEPERRRLGGPNDWLEQQGFYVYREDRLLIAGGWLGLGRGERPWRYDRKYNLARLSVDLTNDADAAWSVDVRKTIAEPPGAVRAEIVRLADRVRRRASGRLRGTRVAVTIGAAAELDGTGLWAPWTATGLQFRVNRRHPLVSRVRRGLEDAGPLRALLDALERTAPLHGARPPLVAVDAVAAARRAQSEADLGKLVRTLYPNYRRIGLSPTDARAKLVEVLGAREHESLIYAIIETLEREGEPEA